MEGGSIFDFTFKLPLLSFLYAFLVLFMIALFLGIIFGLIFGVFAISGLDGPILAVIGLVYAFLALYAPLDYVYTMGINSVSK